MDKLELARLVVAEFNQTQRSSRYFADDFVWDLSGLEGWVEDTEYHGRAAFDRQMERWTEPFESWSMEIAETIDAGGDDVLFLGQQRGALKGSDAAVEMPLAMIGTIRDGKVQRVRLFGRHEQGYHAAGLAPPR